MKPDMLDDGTETKILEAEKVRLVRCPKCRKVLPEFARLSIYQCGGCNTTLQAKHSASAASLSSEKPTEVMLNFDKPSIRKMMDGKRNNNAGFGENGALTYEGLKRSPISITMSNSNECGEDSPSLLVKEGRPFDPLDDRGMGRLQVSTKPIAPVRINKDSDGSTNFTDEPNYSRAKKDVLVTESWKMHGDNGVPYSSTNYSESHHTVLKGKTKTDGKLDGIERRYLRRDEIRDGKLRPRRTSRVSSHGFHPHLDEGPSRYQSNSSFENRKYQKSGFPDTVEQPQVDEAEILRRLDELRDEILRCKIANVRTEDRTPKNRRVHSKVAYESGGPNDWSPEGRYSLNSRPFQPFPSVSEHKMSINSYHQALPTREGMLMHYDAQASQLRTLHKSTYMNMHKKSNLSAYGHFDLVPATSDSHNMFHNRPACSCEHCNNSYMVSYNKRTPYLAGTPSKLSSIESYTGKRTYSPGHSSGSWHDLKPNNSMRNRRTCQSFAGGAPYIICNHCFELLVLPYAIFWKRKKGKLRCGDCSQVVIVMVKEKQLRVVESALVDRMVDGLNHQISGKDKALDSSNHDLSGENIPSAGQDVGMSTLISTTTNAMTEKGHSPKLSRMEIEEGMPPSLGTPKDGSPKAPIYQKDVNDSEDILQHDADENPHDYDSSDRDSPVSPSSDHGVIKYVFGDIAELSKQDRNTALANEKYRSIPKYISPSVTELELPPNEYPNPDLSLDSQDGRKEHQGYRFGRGDVSLAKGQEQKDQQPTQSLDNRRYKVSINGYPISDRNIKKAIKLAGPIQSGDYWYDYKAGFWGIMGHSCLGIIPPFIKEFNFPMPKNCAGGDTGVMVNGRELHRKDLELLASRGLPPTRGRSYIIEISGRIEDAMSGEELGNLGKLAPTVEKMGYGFGMRAPRVKHVSN